MTSSRAEIRDYLFRGLMFEAEAAQFQSAGIQVGADLNQAEERLLSEALSSFPIPLRNQALEMGRLYTIIHCFENSVRNLIKETLDEEVGLSWWDQVPKKTKDKAEQRRQTAIKDSWLEAEKSDVLSFADFGDLGNIIIEFWPYFEPLIPSQHWLRQRMEELEKARNFIAHNRMMLPGEFARVYMYVSDWNRQVGL